MKQESEVKRDRAGTAFCCSYKLVKLCEFYNFVHWII